MSVEEFEQNILHTLNKDCKKYTLFDISNKVVCQFTFDEQLEMWLDTTIFAIEDFAPKKKEVNILNDN